ncbi:MAG TPA: hypothetical protein VG674_31925 [Amycolatopsis sp.]|nr:hypothetical protein [Amycolatopsis sp.]
MLWVMGNGRMRVEDMDVASATERARWLRGDIEAQLALTRIAADDAPDGDKPYWRQVRRDHDELAAVEARLAQLEGRRLWSQWSAAVAWADELRAWFDQDAPDSARPEHDLEPDQATDVVLVLGLAIQRQADRHRLGTGFPVRRIHPNDLESLPTAALAAQVAVPGKIAALMRSAATNRGPAPWLGPRSAPDEFARREFEAAQRRYNDDIPFGINTSSDLSAPGSPATPWDRVAVHCRAVAAWHHTAPGGDGTLAGRKRAREQTLGNAAVLDAATLLWGDPQHQF